MTCDGSGILVGLSARAEHTNAEAVELQARGKGGGRWITFQTGQSA